MFKVLQDAKPTPGKTNQLETTLNDGTKVIFRRDIGKNAHSLYPKYPVGTKVDHFNVEVQTPRVKGGYKTIENLHVVVNNELKPIEAFPIKKRDLFNEFDFQGSSEYRP